MVDEIVDSVYDITCDEADGKSYRVFLFGTDAPTLIDAGLESTVESVFDRIDEIGVEPERLLITTAMATTSAASKRLPTATTSKRGSRNKQRPTFIRTINTETKISLDSSRRSTYRDTNPIITRWLTRTSAS